MRECPRGCGAKEWRRNVYEVTFECGTTTNTDEGGRIAWVGDECDKRLVAKEKP